MNLPFVNKNEAAPIKFKRKDVNFFEIKKGKQTSNSSDLILLMIPLGIVCIMGAVYGFNSVKLNGLQNEYTQAENELKSFDLKTKQPILEKYTLTRDILGTYNSWVSALNNQLRYYRTVNPDILDNIMKLTSGLVECNNITLKSGNIDFAGTALNINNISEFQKKCEGIDGLENLFIRTITKDTVEDKTGKTGKTGKTKKTYEVYKFEMTANFSAFANESAPEPVVQTADPTASPSA